MTVTVESFRQTFPAFSDPGVYDDNMLNFYLMLALNWQNQARWDDNIIDYGTMLFMAHHAVLQVRDNATANAGGIAGTVEGVQTAKSVDKVSVSLDSGAVTLDANAGMWNATRYGIEFLQLARIYGTGGAQLGIGYAPYAYGAWTGFT